MLMPGGAGMAVRVVGLLCALLGSAPGAAGAGAVGSPLLLRSLPTAGRALPVASMLAMRDAQRAARGPELGAELVGEAVDDGALSLRLRGGKKGTGSQGKRATGYGPTLALCRVDLRTAGMWPCAC